MIEQIEQYYCSSSRSMPGSHVQTWGLEHM